MQVEERVARLPCWRGPVEIEPLPGGISNLNLRVRDRGERFVVRLAGDVPVHAVSREVELACSRAAHAAGIAPEVVHAGPGVLVFRHIEGRTLAPEDVRDPAMLARIVPLVRTCHQEVGRRLRRVRPVFWVFHAIRDYAATLAEDGARIAPALPRLLGAAERLEAAVGPIDLVFAHNDLLAANLIDDGRKLWLIDWEYGGFNSPLFDLANLASNNGLAPDQEARLLELYFGAPADAGLASRYDAMKCASLLREALWSLVSERHLEVDFDYAAYAEDYLGRFERAYRTFLHR